MGAVRKMVIELPEDAAAEIEERVSLGEYASASDMILAGLDALKPTDGELDDWIRREAVPVMERLLAHPEEALTMEQVRTRLDALKAQSAAGRQ